AVRVPGDEVAGVAEERDEATVRGDRRRVDAARDVARGAVRLRSRGIDAHARGDGGLSIVDEDVAGAVRVSGDEVGRLAAEGHVPSVGRDVRIVRYAGSPDPRRIDAAAR